MSPGGTQTWTAQSGDEHTYHEGTAPPQHPPTVYLYWEDIGPLNLVVWNKGGRSIQKRKNNLLLMHGLLADTKFSVKSISRLTQELFFLCQLFLLFSTCVKCVNCNMLWLTEPSSIWRVRSGGVRYDKSRNTLSSYSVTVLDRCQNVIYYPAFRTGRNQVKQILLLGRWK